MKALRNALLWLANLGRNPVHQVHLHELPPEGGTVYFLGVFGEVTCSVVGDPDLQIPDCLWVAFDGNPEPFELFVGGRRVCFVRSKKDPSWKRSGK
jgi:hypothetical protein